jgi:hypothetical protein
VVVIWINEKRYILECFKRTEVIVFMIEIMKRKEVPMFIKEFISSAKIEE